MAKQHFIRETYNTFGNLPITGVSHILYELSDGSFYRWDSVLAEYVPWENTFVTGTTFNLGNYDLTLHRNDGVNLTESLAILSSDMVVTGGTYDINTGIVEFTNNSGATFEVSGFTSGMTDSYTTTAYTVGNEVRFDNNIQGSNLYSVDLTSVLSPLSADTLWTAGTGTDAVVLAGSGGIASGDLSVSEGFQTVASGDWSHAEGYGTLASVFTSHAEGYETIASGNYSHAEGFRTSATTTYSHAQGDSTIASGQWAHAEGAQTTASGNHSHAQGDRTVASGVGSNAQNRQTIASGNYSHAEGLVTTASGTSSHAEGWFSVAGGDNSHAEGSSQAFGNTSHAENSGRAYGTGSHAEGQFASAYGQYSHAEGSYTIASGTSSHAEGYQTTASGQYSHAEGNNSQATGNTSHAEGQSTIAGEYAHAEGSNTQATGIYSHAQNYYTIASSQYSTAMGNQTNASGQGSVAIGFQTLASGSYSFAGGTGTVADGPYSTAFGHNNTATTTSYASFVGGGYADDGKGGTNFPNVVSGESCFVYGKSNYVDEQSRTSFALGGNNYIENGSSDGALGTGNYIASAGGSVAIGNGHIIFAGGSVALCQDNEIYSTNSLATGRYTKIVASASHSFVGGQGRPNWPVLAQRQCTFNWSNVSTFGESAQISGCSSNFSAILGGTDHEILGSGFANNSGIFGGDTNKVIGNVTDSGNESVVLGGNANLVSGSTSSAILGGTDNVVVGADRSVVIGGSLITATTSDTVYVPNLNIGTLDTGTTVNNLAIDASGKVIVGEASSSILYTNIPSIQACQSPATASITTSLLSKDDDTLHIKYRTTAISSGGGGSRLVVSGGTTQIAFTHPYDGVTNTNGMVEVHMVKSGTTLVGNAVFVGTPDVYKTYNINVTNFFDGSVTDLIIESTSACEDSQNNNVIIQLLKSQ